MKSILILMFVAILAVGCGTSDNKKTDVKDGVAIIEDQGLPQAPNSSTEEIESNSSSDEGSSQTSDEEGGFWNDLNPNFKEGDVPKEYPHDVAPLYKGTYAVLGGSEFPAGPNGEIGYSVILGTNDTKEEIIDLAFDPIVELADIVSLDFTVNGYRSIIANKEGWSITVNAGTDPEIGFDSFIDYMVVQARDTQSEAIDIEKPDSVIINIDEAEDTDNDGESTTYTTEIGDQEVYISNENLPEDYPLDILPLYEGDYELVGASSSSFGETGSVFIIDLGTNEAIDKVNEQAFDYLLKNADSIEMDMTNQGMRTVYGYKDGWQIILSTIDNATMGGADDEYDCYIEYHLMRE